jgi:hypothetical protein
LLILCLLVFAIVLSALPASAQEIHPDTALINRLQDGVREHSTLRLHLASGDFATGRAVQLRGSALELVGRTVALTDIVAADRKSGSITAPIIVTGAIGAGGVGYWTANAARGLGEHAHAPLDPLPFAIGAFVGGALGAFLGSIVDGESSHWDPIWSSQ